MSERFAQTEEELRFQSALKKLKDIKDGSSVELPLNKIKTSKNIRRKISTEGAEFIQLVESIKESGLLQYPVVSIIDSELLCLSGHRRIEALKTLKWDKVKCIVRHIDDNTARNIAQISENTARKKLQPLDLAHAISRAKEEGGYTSKRLAELLGKERKYIERLIKVNKWPEKVKKLIQDHEEKLSLHILFSLAQRKLSDEELLENIEYKLGLRTKKVSSSIQNKNKGKVQDWFQKNNISSQEKQLIEKFLNDMKLKSWL